MKYAWTIEREGLENFDFEVPEEETKGTLPGN